MYAWFLGWRVRRIVNALSKEIQEYVNCEDLFAKERLKRNFFLLYDNVVNNKLWLSKNFYRL
jgi:hypothetical protein